MGPENIIASGAADKLPIAVATGKFESSAEGAYWSGSLYDGNRQFNDTFGFPPHEINSLAATHTAGLDLQRFLEKVALGESVTQQVELRTLQGAMQMLVSGLATSTQRCWDGQQTHWANFTFNNVTQVVANTEAGFVDQITGLPLMPVIRREIKNLQGAGIPYAILAGDGDYLREVNNNLGHLVGDEYLKEISSILLRVLRIRASGKFSEERRSCFTGQTDVLAINRLFGNVVRNGGDEFSILLPECPDSEIPHVLGRIQDEIRRFNEQNPRLIPLGFSVGGVHSSQIPQGKDPIAAADEALQSAKALTRLGWLGRQGRSLFVADPKTLTFFNSLIQKTELIINNEILTPHEAITVLVAMIEKLVQEKDFLAKIPPDLQGKVSFWAQTVVPYTTKVSADQQIRLLFGGSEGRQAQVMEAFNKAWKTRGL